MKPEHIKHLYWRAGFGITPAEIDKIKHKSRREIVDDIFYDAKSFRPVEVDHSDFKKLYPADIMRRKGALMKIVADLQPKLIELNIAWFKRLTERQGIFREKMTLFWANHFACRDNHSYFMQNFINELRKNALGNFRTMTKAVTREAAMIKFLNLKQNKRAEPNENFARELMELFTLGAGNYTEEDIKQSSRAFTGYNHDFFGNFRFNRRQHDFGRKEFFGRRGYFNGDDVIDIILLEKQCARFVCEKIYQEFVNPKINNDHLEKMVETFYPRYDIEDLMRFVFESDWFYSEKNIGVKIKSPVEFLVGLHHVVPMKFKKIRQVVAIQRSLGQVLLFPPNVAGWAGDKKWIDSNTMLLRMYYPSILLNNKEISIIEKDGFYDRFKASVRRSRAVFQVNANWYAFESAYSDIPIENLHKAILQTPINIGTDGYLDKLKKETKKAHCIQLMSLPEYQMC